MQLIVLVTSLGVLCVIWNAPIRDPRYAVQSYDRQAIHPHKLESSIPCAELPQSQTHCADSATGMLSYTCASNKRLPSLTYLSCQLPHHSEMENCTSQQFERHLYLIAKSYEKLEVVAFEDDSLWDVRAYKWLPLSPNWT